MEQSDSRAFKHLGNHRLNGHGNGGQVSVQRRGRNYYAFVGHMKLKGTSILDVSEPSNPMLLAQIDVPPNTHSHKVRVCGNVMIVNNERLPRSPTEANHTAGLGIFDIKDPSEPRQLSFFPTEGRGVHRFWLDCERKLAHISSTLGGYQANIYRVIDFSNPSRPHEVARWWFPGQYTAHGEVPTWDQQKIRYHLHHPIVLNDRAYLGYHDAGAIILDISNFENIREIGRAPALTGDTHTTLPSSRMIGEMKILVVFDEELGAAHRVPGEEKKRKYMYIYDITDESKPEFLSKFDVPGSIPPDVGRFGPHQPIEDTNMTDNLIFAAWFGGGIRVVDISNPRSPREVAHYSPPVPKEQEVIQTNDIAKDDRGLIYIIDRETAGLDIVEYNPR